MKTRTTHGFDGTRLDGRRRPEMPYAARAAGLYSEVVWHGGGVAAVPEKRSIAPGSGSRVSAEE